MWIIVAFQIVCLLSSSVITASTRKFSFVDDNHSTVILTTEKETQSSLHEDDGLHSGSEVDARSQRFTNSVGNHPVVQTDETEVPTTSNGGSGVKWEGRIKKFTDSDENRLNSLSMDKSRTISITNIDFGVEESSQKFTSSVENPPVLQTEETKVTTTSNSGSSFDKNNILHVIVSDENSLDELLRDEKEVILSSSIKTHLDSRVEESSQEFPSSVENLSVAQTDETMVTTTSNNDLGNDSKDRIQEFVDLDEQDTDDLTTDKENDLYSTSVGFETEENIQRLTSLDETNHPNVGSTDNKKAITASNIGISAYSSSSFHNKNNIQHFIVSDDDSLNKLLKDEKEVVLSSNIDLGNDSKDRIEEFVDLDEQDTDVLETDKEKDFSSTSIGLENIQRLTDLEETNLPNVRSTDNKKAITASNIGTSAYSSSSSNNKDNVQHFIVSDEKFLNELFRDEKETVLSSNIVTKKQYISSLQSSSNVEAGSSTLNPFSTKKSEDNDDKYFKWLMSQLLIVHDPVNLISKFNTAETTEANSSKGKIKSLTTKKTKAI